MPQPSTAEVICLLLLALGCIVVGAVSWLEGKRPLPYMAATFVGALAAYWAGLHWFSQLV